VVVAAAAAASSWRARRVVDLNAADAIRARAGG
jgi:hypothetical protein